MKFLISQLYLLALFALPFVSTSCSDDDDNSTKVEISSLGVEDGTTIVTGQIIQLEAQLSNPQGEVHYSWSTAGKEVSTQSTYTFQSDVTGTHTITLTVTANNEAQEKSINIIVVKPPFYVINEGQGKGSVNRYKQEQWQYNIVEGLGVTSTVGIINNGYMYIVSKQSPFLVKMNGNYTLFTLILKKFTFMIITFKLFVIFAPNIQIRLDFSNHCNDIK